MAAGGGAGATAGGAIYGLGIFGAWVYFWQEADTVAAHLLALLEGIFWPAFLVYQTLDALHA